MITVAWRGDPALKSEVRDRMVAHRDADEIVQRMYQRADPTLASGYKGCLIGCTLPPQQPLTPERSGDLSAPIGGWHRRVEDLYGIPRSVGKLLDRIFEGLPHGAHAQFAVDSIDAIPVGADLTLTASRLTLDILTDPEHGVQRAAADGSAQWAAVDAVARLYRRRLAGNEPDPRQWCTARYDAYDAAGPRPDATGYSAAETAAYAAAQNYTDAVVGAGSTNPPHREYGFGSATFWAWAAERILTHLRQAPVPARAGTGG
jgi:hypothetical protein